MPRRKALRTIYKSLRPLISDVSQGNPKKNDWYHILLKAALVKSYDFNSYVSSLRSTTHSFYLTATLRGICEDIIFLRSILGFSIKDRSELLTKLMWSCTLQGLSRQAQFFDQIRPEQPVLKEKDSESKLKSVEKEIIQIFAANNLTNAGRRPTIRQLAKSSNLLALYDYMYSATSNWVHFSPQILFRMGWSPEKALDATYTFSTKHFTQYYAEFNKIYGTYLFIFFHDNFKDELRLDSTFSLLVSELRDNIEQVARWPELVTFEEMNRTPPNFGAIQALMPLLEQSSSEDRREILQFVLTERSKEKISSMSVEEKRDSINQFFGGQIMDEVLAYPEEKLNQILHGIRKDLITSMKPDIEARVAAEILSTIPAEELIGYIERIPTHEASRNTVEVNTTN